MSPNMSLFSVNALLILGTDGTRILSKYYSALPPANAAPGSSFPGANPYPSVKEQRAFEKGLLEKTSKSNNDVIIYDGRIVLFKTEGDVNLYCVGGPDQNEILLFSVCLCLRDSLAVLLKNSTDKRTILENYDTVSLAIDEICDDGIILETDPVIVASRVSKPPAQDMVTMKNIDLSEQGMLNMWEFGKQKLAERMRQGL